MNGWTAAATALLLCGFAPAACGVATGRARRRVPAQNVATTLLSLVFLLLSQGFARPAYVDTALMLSVLGPAGTLLFVRLLADQLAEHPPGQGRLRALTVVNYVAVAAVVVPLSVAAGPGRAMVKLLIIGVLLALGCRVATRAVHAAAAMGHGRGAPTEGMSDDR
ncbi:monovalent cation/H+ antiporter complex subunit F [Streptomyces sp. NPDC021749]|uniref:monovalent cation/H+ antiporter complex subunit F n=1 Tax=Streptomyces sp. NPDC021749 TaxID=3154905 RepID=UPI0033EFEA14